MRGRRTPRSVFQDGTAATTSSSRAPESRTRTKVTPITRLPGPRPSNEGRQRTEEEDDRRGQESKRARQRKSVGPLDHRRLPPTRPVGNEGERPTRTEGIRRRPLTPRKEGEKRRREKEVRGETPALLTRSNPTLPRTWEARTSGDASRFSPASTSGSFDSLFRVLFDFPSRYLSSIGSSSRI